MIVINNILDVEKYLEDIEVVLFDLDDTLFSEKEYIKSGFDQIQKFYPHIPDFSRKLWNAFMSKKNPIDYILQKENMSCEKERCIDIYRRHKPILHLYPGVREMLARIKKIKRLGIITDGRVDGQKAKIEALGLCDEYYIITDELGGTQFRKPNIRAFEIAKEHFGVSYSKMVYVGDNINKDGIAPCILGMEFIYFKNIEGIYYNKNIYRSN